MSSTPSPDEAPKYLKNRVTRSNGTVVEYAITRVDGEVVSLGRYGNPDGFEKYQRIRDEWLVAREYAIKVESTRLTVADLVERWLTHQHEQVNAGRLAKRRYYAAKYAAEALLREHAGMRVESFGTAALLDIQSRLAATPCNTKRGRYRDAKDPPMLSRTEVNARVNDIRRIFKWGVVRELVPEGRITKLQAVEGLGIGDARESEPREAADPEHVRALVAELDARGHFGEARALELVRWTGCRPGEVCTLRAANVFSTPDGLELRVKNKTKKQTGKDRIVQLNERAAGIVRAALEAGRSIDPDRFLFMSNRGRPLNSNTFGNTLRRVGRAAGLPTFHPYQLRHLAATEAIEAGCSEVEVAAMLGHTPHSTVVRRYSKDRAISARRGANAIGGREAG